RFARGRLFRRYAGVGHDDPLVAEYAAGLVARVEQRAHAVAFGAQLRVAQLQRIRVRERRLELVGVASQDIGVRRALLLLGDPDCIGSGRLGESLIALFLGAGDTFLGLGGCGVTHAPVLFALLRERIGDRFLHRLFAREPLLFALLAGRT